LQALDFKFHVKIFYFKSSLKIFSLHSQIPNPKHQTTNKFQIPIFNDQSKFGMLLLILLKGAKVWDFEFRSL